MATKVLDETGKVREWLERDGAIRVWKSADLSRIRPDMFTQVSHEKPFHWAYLESEVETDLVFYRKSMIVKEWSDTPAGYKAAVRAIGSLARDNGDAPLKLAFTYTVENVCYETTERREDKRPIGVHYYWAIVQWTAPREES